MQTGLYVHVPYCHTKCGYCDFYSLALGQRRSGPVVAAMLCELNHRVERLERLDTIFVGGGTPTVLPLEELTRLFGRLGDLARSHAVGEFTTEANPATVDPAKISALVATGVNRMSLGAQSLHRQELQALDRLHDPQDIEPAVRAARAGGIEQINIDLMFGIPGQTLDSWRETLLRAVGFGVDHLSCYGLMYEPRTALTARMQHGMVTPCEHALEADMYLLCIELLGGCGYEHYEISNFARPGCACRHNLIYWSNWPYLGIGPSAASYLDGVRSRNVAHVETYVAEIQRGTDASREREQLTGAALAGETAMLQLRLSRGIDVAQFERQVGLDPRTLYADELAALSREGLIDNDGSFIRLTARGRLLADRVIREFLLVDPPDGNAARRIPIAGAAGPALAG